MTLAMTTSAWTSRVLYSPINERFETSRQTLSMNCITPRRANRDTRFANGKEVRDWLSFLTWRSKIVCCRSRRWRWSSTSPIRRCATGSIAA